MKLLDCPKWEKDDNSALPEIAQAASAFFSFTQRQNEKKYVLTHGDIKAWHKKYFEKIVKPTYYAGNYRGVDISKPCLNQEVHVGPAFGAPAANVAELMKKFSDELAIATKATDEFLATSLSPSNKVQAAAQLAAFAGGKIIQIHPFINGNGRMARMAMNYFLYRYTKRIPFFIDRPNHPDYSTASATAMSSGNFTPLYQYLIEILITLAP